MNSRSTWNAQTILTSVLDKYFVRRRDFVSFNGARLELIDMLSDEVGRMVLDLSAYVWSQKIQDETVTLTARYPATAWQAFKRRWFPAWALLRWPVQESTVTETHRFRTVALFPGFRYEAPPGIGQHVLRSIVEKTSES